MLQVKTRIKALKIEVSQIEKKRTKWEKEQVELWR